MVNAFAELLKDANFDAWESVQSALTGLPEEPSEHAQWLMRHIWETKLEYGRLIAQALSTSPPPELDLDGLMAWEVQRAWTLTPTELIQTVQYAERIMTVGEVLSLNVRHSAWHASQLMALLKQEQRLGEGAGTVDR